MQAQADKQINVSVPFYFLCSSTYKPRLSWCAKHCVSRSNNFCNAIKSGRPSITNNISGVRFSLTLSMASAFCHIHLVFIFISAVVFNKMWPCSPLQRLLIKCNHRSLSQQSVKDRLKQLAQEYYVQKHKEMFGTRILRPDHWKEPCFILLKSHTG